MHKDSFNVLAIDDDPGDLELLRRSLDRIVGLHIAYHPVQDSAEGLDLLKKLPIDIVFLDYMLGAESGVEVLRMIRDSGDDRPVIFVTGRGDEYVAAESARYGADDYLSKSNIQPGPLKRVIEGATERANLRKEKSRLLEELKNMRKAETVATMAAGLAHDFNNKLTSLQGFLDLALALAKDEKLVGYLQKMNEPCVLMAEEIGRLLTLTVGTTSRHERVDVTSMVKNLKESLVPTVESNIRFDVKVEEGLQIFGSHGTVRQALISICTNAIEAMEQGGKLTLRANRMEAGSDVVAGQSSINGRSYVLIEVGDTGCGMAPETVEQVFDPFFSTKGMGTQTGVGLSLAVAWQSITGLDGHIDVESSPGEGSQFKVFLPIDG